MNVVKTTYEVSKPFYMERGVIFRREHVMENNSIAGYTWTAETLGM